MKKYTKGLVALVGFVLTTLNLAYGSNPKVQLVIALATAIGVYQLPNRG